MQLDLKRFFVRALLPVRLSDGHEFHFGVWLETSEEAAKQLWTNWERPEYSAVRFDATLANAVPPWDESVLGAPCVAGIRNQDQLPYIESSTNAHLAAVMATPWPRAELMAHGPQAVTTYGAWPAHVGLGLRRGGRRSASGPRRSEQATPSRRSRSTEFPP